MASTDYSLLPQLTPDDQVWRVDWFGDVVYPGTVRRYAQPSVKMALSPIRCDPFDRNALISPDGSDYHHQHETWVPIAAMPMLAIGDLWQQGQRIVSPDYQVESFKRLTASPETISFVKAGLAIDGNFLIPLNQHPWHRRHTQSYCITIKLDDQRRLLVPCIEIIRFYFGSSSNLIQRLFTGPLREEMLWNSKRFNTENRHLHLVLANRLSGLSASDIGRIAGNSFAWRSAAGIYASCQKASAQGHTIYPLTGLPFEGTTDLAVSGIWLPFNGQEKATFLAYRIRSCSHPFPFKSLSYEAGDRKAKHAAPESGDSRTRQYARRSTKDRKAEVVDLDPGTNKPQREATFTTQHRFPDLLRKPVWRDKIESTPHPDVYLRHEDGNLEQVAIGESDWSAPIRGVGSTLSNEGDRQVNEKSSLPWFVRTGLKDIEANLPNKGPGTQIKIICPAGKHEPVFTLPVIIDDDGVIAGEVIFTEGNGSIRQRRGCFIGIVEDNKPVELLVVVEGKERLAHPNVFPVAKAEIAFAVKTIINPHHLR